MCFCFIGAILPMVCKTKFSNASYDIFLPMLKQVTRLSLNFSLSKCLQSRYVAIYGFCFLKLVLKTKATILWKSDSPVSMHLAFKSLSCLLVSISSMHEGFLGFLKQVGLFTILSKLQVWQYLFKEGSLISLFKSPTISILPHFEFISSKPLLILDRCCFVLPLCGFQE